jgi:pimeloyl-ACP methyl ester carboxylesterase
MPDPQRSDRYRTVDVPVRGGKQRVGLWEPVSGAAEARDLADAPTILAIHGVTASHRCWDMLAAALPGYRLITPDLRGRGRSNTLPGPYGMAQHADDMADVLDFLGVPQALVVGHSMGGFVSVMFAHRHAGRVASVLLVDGGMPLRMPDGMTTDSLIAALGPAADRLSMTFPDYEAYRNFWRVHPAFVDSWNQAVTNYIDYDLVGIPPELHPATPIAAMTADIPDQYGTDIMLEAVAKLPAPTIFLRAPLGFFNDPPGIYAPDWIEHWQQQLPALDVREIEGVNHYTIVFTDLGVGAVKDAVLESLRRADLTH